MFQLFKRRLPQWPPLAGVAALVGAIVVSTVVPLLVMIPAAIADVDAPTPSSRCWRRCSSPAGSSCSSSGWPR